MHRWPLLQSVPDSVRMPLDLTPVNLQHEQTKELMGHFGPTAPTPLTMESKEHVSPADCKVLK